MERDGGKLSAHISRRANVCTSDTKNRGKESNLEACCSPFMSVPVATSINRLSFHIYLTACLLTREQKTGFKSCFVAPETGWPEANAIKKGWIRFVSLGNLRFIDPPTPLSLRYVNFLRAKLPARKKPSIKRITGAMKRWMPSTLRARGSTP